MKQFILMIVSLLVISCSVDKVASSQEPIENPYKEQLQGFWYGDSIYTLWGDSLHQDTYNCYYEFKDDTLITITGGQDFFLFNVIDDTIKINSLDSNYLHSYQILNIDDSILKLKCNWNQNILKFIK